jgi:signal transduction histidine kinase
MAGRVSLLEAKLEKAVNDQEKIDLMNELALELRYQDLERALDLCRQSACLAEHGGVDGSPYILGTAASLYVQGVLEMQRGHYESALELFAQSTQLYEREGNSAETIRGLGASGRALTYLGDYRHALDYYSKALKLSRQCKDQMAESTSLNSLGMLYTQLGQWNRALDYLEQSLDLAVKLNEPLAQADALGNCAICHFQLGEDNQALQTAQQSLEIYRALGARQGEAEVLNSLGVILLETGNVDKALAHFQQSLHISEEIGNRLEATRVLRNISNIYLSQEAVPQALTELKHALVLAEDIHSRHEQMYIHQALSAIYKQTEQPTLALFHFEIAASLHDQIFHEQLRQNKPGLQPPYPDETARLEAQNYHLMNIALQQEIDERRQAEQALRLANEQLSNKIREREELISDLNAFSHMVAHDLKNPLTAITGYATMLSSLLKECADEKSLSYLEIITQTSFRMSRIIDEMLLLASVREKPIETRPLNMAKIIEEVLARLEHMLAKHKAEVIMPTVWPVAVGYGPWVEEVWANYITNAIQYGGKPPLVKLGSNTPSGGKVCFWVQDNGAGLTPEQQQKLFSSFTRLDHYHGPGHGLGLSIVRRILERLDGEAGVECSGIPGEGCKFTFTLPIATTSDLV